MSRNQMDATFDYLGILKAAGLVAASAGTTAIDLGVGRVDARAILNVTACEVGTGDEKYEVEVQLCASSGFAAGVFVAAVAKFGDSTVNGESDDTAVPRQQEIAFCNEINGTTYRYMRLYTRIAGTIATGINYEAHLAKKA